MFLIHFFVIEMRMMSYLVTWEYVQYLQSWAILTSEKAFRSQNGLTYLNEHKFSLYLAVGTGV